MAYPFEEVQDKKQPPYDLAEKMLGRAPVDPLLGDVRKNIAESLTSPGSAFVKPGVNPGPSRETTDLAERVLGNAPALTPGQQYAKDNSVSIGPGPGWKTNEEWDAIDAKNGTKTPESVRNYLDYQAEQEAKAARGKENDQAGIFGLADQLIKRGVSPDKAPGAALEMDQILHPEKYVKDQNFSTDRGVYSTKDKRILPGSEPQTVTPSGMGQPVKDSETGEVIGHYVDGKFVKAGSETPFSSMAKMEPAELNRYTRRSEEINQRLTELDRERAGGNKKKGADWWFPSQNFDQERQKLETEQAGITAVLSGRPAQLDRTDRTNQPAAAKPSADEIRAELARRKAGR